MKQNTSESKENSSEIIFNEFMQRGDDFFKIELLRQAITWYRKAFEINNENEKVKLRISECERLLAYENKVVFILLLLTVVLLLIYFFLVK